MDHLVVVRGGGDLGSGTAWRLHRSGFPVIVLDIERPLAVRRTVAYSSAVGEGAITIEGVEGFLVDHVGRAIDVATSGEAIAVLVSADLPSFSPSVIVDARLAKAPLDTAIDQAPLVVGLGPGLIAGVHCTAAVETNRGHRLGKVLWEGEAEPNTGRPGDVGGANAERVVRAATDGIVTWDRSIADLVNQGDRLGAVDGDPVTAPIGGVIRGLIADGPVKEGLKVGDIDPRGNPAVCYEISDKSRAVAGGTLEAVMTWLSHS